MELHRKVIVLDAANVEEVSAFWAGMLDGRVIKDPDGSWHSVIDSSGEWVIGVQQAPNHVRPNWPSGEQQQIHLDLHVKDFKAAHAQVMELGAVVLQASSNIDADEGFQVYADPAGHPFCLGWGQPTSKQLRKFLS